MAYPNFPIGIYGKEGINDALPSFVTRIFRPKVTGEQNQQRHHLLCSAPLLHSLMSVATSSHPRPIQMWACFQRCNSNLRAHAKLTTDQDGTVCQFIKRQIPSLRHIGLQRGLLTKHLFNRSILYRAGGFAFDLKLRWHHEKHAPRLIPSHLLPFPVRPTQ